MDTTRLDFVNFNCIKGEAFQGNFKTSGVLDFDEPGNVDQAVLARHEEDLVHVVLGELVIACEEVQIKLVFACYFYTSDSIESRAVQTK